MIGLNTIATAAAAVIPGKYKVYEEAIEQIDLSGGGVLYIHAESLLCEVLCGCRSVMREILIDVAYVEDYGIKNSQMDGFISDMAGAFLPFFEFEDRKLVPIKVNSRIEDGIGRWSFILRFADSIDVTNEARDMMGEITIN